MTHPNSQQSNKQQNQQTSILNIIEHSNLAPTNNNQSINQVNTQINKKESNKQQSNKQQSGWAMVVLPVNCHCRRRRSHHRHRRRRRRRHHRCRRRRCCC
jgi:hypothetical protein